MSPSSIYSMTKLLSIVGVYVGVAVSVAVAVLVAVGVLVSVGVGEGVAVAVGSSVGMRVGTIAPCNTAVGVISLVSLHALIVSNVMNPIKISNLRDCIIPMPFAR